MNRWRTAEADWKRTGQTPTTITVAPSARKGPNLMARRAAMIFPISENNLEERNPICFSLARTESVRPPNRAPTPIVVQMENALRLKAWDFPHPPLASSFVMCLRHFKVIPIIYSAFETVSGCICFDIVSSSAYSFEGTLSLLAQVHTLVKIPY